MRFPTRTRIKWRLHWHPLWQPPLRCANPCPLHASADSFKDTLYDDSPVWICEPAPCTHIRRLHLQRHPVLDLQTLTPTRTRRHLQRHPLRQPALGSANPDPYTHHDDTSGCDSRPVLDLQTLTPTHTRQHLQRRPVWQPGLVSANPDPYRHSDTLWQPGLGSANPHPYTHQKTIDFERHCLGSCKLTPRHTGLGSANLDPYTHQTTPPTTPCVTAPGNESTKFANPHPPTWSKNPYRLFGEKPKDTSYLPRKPKHMSYLPKKTTRYAVSSKKPKDTYPNVS